MTAACAAYDQRVSVDSVDDLYGLALDRFVPTRAALVKRLRGEKRRGRAREVAALRKPSVAAWAVNQIVRTQPEALGALFAAGNDLARAQERAAAGRGGGDAVRDATHRQREVVRELLEAAQGLLGSEGQGVSQATIERVGETLRAAASDEDARGQVAGGCLTRELRFVGLGIGGLTPSLGGGGDTRSLPGRETRGSGEPGQGRGGRRDRREVDTGSAAATRGVERAREIEAERAAARERDGCVEGCPPDRSSRSSCRRSRSGGTRLRSGPPRAGRRRSGGGRDACLGRGATSRERQGRTHDRRAGAARARPVSAHR